ncbi:MAG: hypothetical protein H6Q07_1678, partial [Acidobacteria bacterium]|nr:hypothetical protein [Acidobacteriota bacterium]
MPGDKEAENRETKKRLSRRDFL